MSERFDRAEIDEDRTSSLAPARTGRIAMVGDRTWTALPWAVLGVLVIVLGLVTIDLGDKPAQTTAPQASEIAVVGAATPSPFPTGEHTSCSNVVGLQVSAAPGLHDARVRPRLDRGGIAAYTTAAEIDSGSVVVAIPSVTQDGSEVANLRVATYSVTGAPAVTASVIGWLGPRDRVLVLVSTFERTGIGQIPGPRFRELRAACAGLYFVGLDSSGVTRITSDSGGSIGAVALAPRFRQVAYDAGDAVVVVDETGTRSSVAAECTDVWSLAWSYDEENLIVVCEGTRVIATSPSGSDPRSFDLPAGAIALAASWSQTGITVVSASAEPQLEPLTIYDVDLDAGAIRPRLTTSTASSWLAVHGPISPSGRRLFINGGGPFAAFAEYAVDLLDGSTTQLPGGFVFDSPVAWSADEMQAWWFGDGTLVQATLGTDPDGNPFWSESDIGQLVEADSVAWLADER
jgi:hypothetical protein